MAWSIDGIRIFPTKYGQSEKAIIAELQPVTSGTILHYFGWEDELVRLDGYIVSPADRLAVRAALRAGLPVTLSGPNGVIDDFTIKSFDTDRMNIICQTLRPDLASDEIVLQFSMELRRDE